MALSWEHSVVVSRDGWLAARMVETSAMTWGLWLAVRKDDMMAAMSATITVAWKAGTWAFDLVEH